MRDIIISDVVQYRLSELGLFLTQEYNMSPSTSEARISRIYRLLGSLSAPGDSALCRFRPWNRLGYHCIAFEGWVFAYEIFDDGVIVRDMSHGKLLVDVVY
jgi:hypothetical protein